MKTEWKDNGDKTFTPVIDRGPAPGEVAPGSAGVASAGVSPRFAREDHDHAFSGTAHTHAPPTIPRWATLVVAASNSSAAGKAGADYVCDGTADQTEINTAVGTAGRMVVLLEGTFTLSAKITMAANTSLVGMGAGATTITGDIADWLVYSTADGVLVRDVKVSNGNAAGGAVGVDSSGRTVVANCHLTGYQAVFGFGLSSQGCVVRDCRIVGTYAGIVVSGQNATISGNTITGVVTNCGILVNNSDAVQQSCVIVGNHIKMGNGALAGIEVLSGSSFQAQVEVVGNWIDCAGTSGSNTNGSTYGVLVESVDGVYTANRILNARRYGMALTERSHDNIVEGNLFRDNGRDGSTRAHLLIADGTIDPLRNNIIGNVFRGTDATYSVHVNGAGPTDNIILGNDFKGGFATSAVSDAGTGTRIVNNRGHNPQGAAAITVTASPFTYTAGATPEEVHITGGTVTTVVKDGVTLYAVSDVSVNLSPGEAVVVTYTGAPTMTKNRQ